LLEVAVDVKLHVFEGNGGRWDGVVCLGGGGGVEGAGEAGVEDGWGLEAGLRVQV